MSKISRRSLARYAADQLVSGQSATKLAEQLSAILVEEGTVNNLDFLMGDIIWELEQRGELAIGRATSAHPLTQELQTALKAQLKLATQAREVILEPGIDKSVLGGIKVETSGQVWDGTLSRKLRSLRETF